MTTARKEVVVEGEEGVYHVGSRCVRKAYLCGYEESEEVDYSYRKEWLVERMFFLSEIFTVKILSYAVMSNHYHLVLWLRPQQTKQWSSQEVARRWLKLYPPKDYRESKNEECLHQKIMLLSQDEERIEVLRERLGNLSWFMGRLNQHLAQLVNREEKTTGSFWEKRFFCKRLVDPSGVLASMAYVDLNPIRAKLAETPETSEFTSAYDRIVALQEEESSQEKTFEREKAIARAKQLCALKEEEELPIPITTEAYLELLDWTGRSILADKPGAIPSSLSPILSRLKIRQQHWPQAILSYSSLFWRIIGSFSSMVLAAKKAQKQWFQGLNASKSAFYH